LALPLLQKAAGRNAELKDKLTTPKKALKAAIITWPAQTTHTKGAPAKPSTVMSAGRC
jgi:hypothetical protein